jgi:L,D-transpeptidase catalytic domain
MRRASAFSTIVVCAIAAPGDAEAKLDLYIDKSTQQMSVIRNGALLYAWPVSTGLDRFSTPSGVYMPERLEPIWYSKAYNTPMPYAIFFHQGYAIHGSYDITQLGGPASHGCVRLHPQEAALLFAMVEQEGPANTTIVVAGGPPAPVPPRYRDVEGPPRPPYVRDSAIAPGAYPPNPGMPPYYDPYRYADGPERGRGDDGRSAMRDAYPNRPPPRLDGEAPMEPPLGVGGRNRPPQPRPDAQVPMEPTLPPRRVHGPPASRFEEQAAIEPALPPRGRYRPPAPPPVTAISNSKCPTCAPNRAPDEPANRNASANHSAKSLPSSSSLPSPFSDSMRLGSAPSGSAQSSWPPSASPPPAQPASPSPPAPAASSTPAMPQPSEAQQSGSRYRVLPRSYWAGASWRWRLKAEHEIGPPSPAPDAQ